MKYFFFKVFLISLVFSNNYAFSNTNKANEFIAERTKATKYLLTPPKIVKKRISDALYKIKNECCEENFSQKNKIYKINDNLKKCLDKKCQTFVLPIYSNKKPPLKLIVLRQLEELDDLIILNSEKKYENFIKQSEAEKNEIKIQNEKDIDKVKKKVLNLEKQNEKLKLTVDKILSKYQEKITKLEEENKKLTDNFNLVFEAHPKVRQKKLEKELK